MPMRIGTAMPALEDATEWLNGSIEEASRATEGHPVLIHFWSLSCGMCKDNLPRVAEWRQTFWEAGLRLIAIDMPRYPADTDVNAVREALVEYGIIEPAALVTGAQWRDAFPNENGYVPAYYLFDAGNR